MDDQRNPAAMSDADIDRALAQALAVAPSPEFTARVRTRIASEPAPRSVFVPWRFVAIGAAAAILVLAVVLGHRENGSQPAAVTEPLVARATIGTSSLPYVGSGFSRTRDVARVSTSYVGSGFSRTRDVARVSTSYVGSGFSRTFPVGPPEGGPHVQVLLDPRETAALRSLLAGVRDNRVDLRPLVQPGTPPAMELPPVKDLVIAPLAIELLAPDTGAEGDRQ